MANRAQDSMVLTARDRRAETVRLHAGGTPLEAISRKMGVSLATTHRDWVKGIEGIAKQQQITPDQARVATVLKLDGITSLAKKAIVDLLNNGEARAVAPLINSLVRAEALTAEVLGAKQVAAQVDVHTSAAATVDLAAVEHLLGRASADALQSAAVPVEALPTEQ